MASGGAAMLSECLETYLALKRSVGFKFDTEAMILRRYVRVAEICGDSHVRTTTAVEWARTARSPNERERRLGIVRRFATEIQIEDPVHEVPPEHVFSRKVERRIPLIFSREQVNQLLEAAVAQRSSGERMCPRTYHTVFGLLACTGMRVSEALALRVTDVDEQGLVVRQTKFRKSRLVPLHSTAALAMRQYLRERASLLPEDDHVFLACRNKRLEYAHVATAFRRLIRKLGLDQGGRSPHMHDLRHTFAVRVLEQCPTSRDKAGRHLRALATYLGHVNIKNTYWYLHATPQLFRDMADAGEAAFGGGES